MRWFHWSVEEFESLENLRCCEFVIMEKNEETNKYKLKTKFRKWKFLGHSDDEDEISNSDEADKGDDDKHLTPNVFLNGHSRSHHAEMGEFSCEDDSDERSMNS